jgi:hypothetical protein
MFHCWTLLLLYAAIFTGCVQNGLTHAPASMSENNELIAEGNWHIFFKLSGGFAGYRKTMELSNTGVVTAADEKSGRRVTGSMTEREISEIALLAEDIKSIQPSERPANCADCLNYDLTVLMNDQRFSFQLNDLSLPQSGLEPFISILLSLQERIITGKPLN